MLLKEIALVLLGVWTASADLDLGSFVAGRPTNHGVPGAQTFGGVLSFQRPQVDPRPPSFQQPQVDPRPPVFSRYVRSASQPRTQMQPTPPPGYQPRPPVQPTPPPGHIPAQTLPDELSQDKSAQLPPKSELLKSFPRPGRPHPLPGTLLQGSDGDQKTARFNRPTRPGGIPGAGVGRPEPLPGPLPQWPQTLPAPLPGTPVVLPGILPVIPETLPATLPEEKAASLPPKSQLTKPASHPQPLPAALPQGVQTLPAVLPGRPQTLPADLTEEKTSPLPPKSELTKPASRPHQTEDNDGFAPLPTGPQVQPRPPPRDLTKPAPRPPRPQVQPAQTLPVELPSDKTAQLPPKSELLKPASRPPRPQVDPKPTPGQLTKPASRPDDSEENDGFAPLPTGPQVQPRPPPGDLTKPAPRTQHSQVQSTPPSGFQAAQVLPERPPADLKPAARPQSQARPAGKLTKPASKPVRPQRLPGELSQNPDEKQFFREDAGPFASPAEVPDVLALLPVSHPLTQVPRDVRFSCQNRYPGMYADQDYECQVFHWCLGDERMFSFLCGYGTSFNQRLLTCDYQHLVRCDLADQAYEVNTRVWNENGDFIF